MGHEQFGLKAVTEMYSVYFDFAVASQKFKNNAR